MGKIIDDFLTVLPRIQAKHIEEELNLKRQRTAIRTATELRAQFQAQLRTLLESDSFIRFVPVEQFPDALISSDRFNEQFGKVASDLKALFEESNLLADAADLQLELYKNEILSRLRKAFKEAEKELDRLKFLHKNISGFEDAIVETFVAGSSRLSRADVAAPRVYIDPQLQARITIEFDMPVDSINQGLVLPLTSDSRIELSVITDQQTSDVRDEDDDLVLPRGSSPSTNSDPEVIPDPVFIEENPLDPGGVAIAPNSIINVIDNQQDTLWIKEIFLKERLISGAKLNVRIDLGGIREINYIEIQPFGDFAPELSEMFYVEPTGNVKAINLTVTTLRLDGPVRVHFDTVQAKEIVILFTQKNGFEVPYRVPGPERNANRIGYRYIFGLDNIFVGIMNYRAQGYYVSRTLSKDNITLLGLFSKENNTLGITEDHDPEIIENILPPIEYYIAFRDLDQSDAVVFETFLPIAPAASTEITQKLIVRANDTALLSFTVVGDDLAVYRNSVLLVQGGGPGVGDYHIVAQDETISNPTVIKINGGLREAGEHVAVYTPFYQSDDAPQTFTDETGLIRYRKDNLIEVVRPEASRAVKSEANLIAIMRGMEPLDTTSIINEYKFAVA